MNFFYIVDAVGTKTKSTKQTKVHISARSENLYLFVQNLGLLQSALSDLFIIYAAFFEFGLLKIMHFLAQKLQSGIPTRTNMLTL